MHVHPVLLRIAEASHLQLPRPGPDGQPNESSQLDNPDSGRVGQISAHPERIFARPVPGLAHVVLEIEKQIARIGASHPITQEQLTQTVGAKLPRHVSVTCKSPRPSFGARPFRAPRAGRADSCASWADLCALGFGGKAYNRNMPTDFPTNADLSSEIAALKRQVAHLLRLLGQVDAGGRALSISQFCARNNISRSFFYKLKKRRKGPRIMDVDGRQIISPEAERDWRLERERETATAARRLAPHAAPDERWGRSWFPV
jgi:hypothetical protein